MASLMKMVTIKRTAKLRKAGRKRKNKMAKKSTLTMNELFAEIDKAAGTSK
jgi:hypothetical protein